MVHSPMPKRHCREVSRHYGSRMSTMAMSDVAVAAMGNKVVAALVEDTVQTDMM